MFHPWGLTSVGKTTTTLVRGLDGICGDFEDDGAFAGCFVMMDDLMDVQNWVVVSNIFLKLSSLFAEDEPSLTCADFSKTGGKKLNHQLPKMSCCFSVLKDMEKFPCYAPVN